MSGLDIRADRQSVTDDEAGWWDKLKRDRCSSVRERLFARYAPFARNIARRIHRETSQGDIDLLDLQQLAYAGLLEALDRFDPEQGVPFRRFASHRITGSIRDGLSRMNEVREQISWRHRAKRERLRSLAEEHGDSPAGDAMEKLAELAVGLAIGFILEGTGLFAEDDGTPRNNRTGYESTAWNEIVADVHAELDALPEREALILREHYINDVGFDELASLLRLSKGRISQLHQSALLLLRKRLAGRGHFRLGG